MIDWFELPIGSLLPARYAPAAHLGMIIVPTGYADPILFEAETPYGASSVSENTAKAPSPSDLAVARFQGRRVTRVVAVLRSVDGDSDRSRAQDGALDETFPASDPPAVS